MTKHVTTQSQNLFKKASQIFPGGVNSPVRAFRSVGGSPFVVQRGEGAYLYDVDGNRYVDFINSWGPLVLGHAAKEVVTAICEQAEKGTSFGASAEREIQLALVIQRHFPSLEMMRFVNSGTEAGMSVIRLARGFTGRNKVVKFSGCYHGHVDSLLVEAGSGVATLGIPSGAGVPEDFTKHTIVCPFNDKEAFAQVLSRWSDEIAAVILEPVMGNAGLILPEKGYLEYLREECDGVGALLIFDEVMTGFRVSLGGVQGLYDIRPDLTMLGKVIGGGLPVGAFGGRREIMEHLAPLGPVYQAGTLSGNPLAMAAGLATLTAWEKPGVFDDVKSATAAFMEKLSQKASERGIPLTSNSIGSMFGFFFSHQEVQNFEAAKQSDTDRFRKFFHLVLERGVYLAPSPFEAGFVSAAHLENKREPLRFALAQMEEALAML